MAGSAAGAEMTAARRIGVTLEEWRARRAAGEKWCSGCRTWHPLADFKVDPTRSDGRSAKCPTARSVEAKAHYVTRQRPSVGRRIVAQRDGDKRQARRRVNYLVEAGVLPDPDDVVCTDCGHKGPGRRHEYHHLNGYEAGQHENVVALCSGCHHLRERSNG